ncbi:hypothetical protein PGB90_010604 [Kerria lacca]
MAKRKMTRTSNFPKVLKTNLKTSEEVVRINNETKFFNNFDEFLNKIEADRNQVGKTIMEFKFNKKRCRVLSQCNKFPDWGKGVIYWMFRDERIEDNWALLYAQKLALKNEVPLHVCFCLLPRFLDANIRHFDFIFKGLEEIESTCKNLNIQFHFLIGCGKDILPSFVERHKFGAVIIDFCPLRIPLSWAEDLSHSLPRDVPLIQVDTHNIVPCWVASDKQEYAARTIRNKINNKLNEFLTEFPPVIKHPYISSLKADLIDWKNAGKTLEVDKTIKPVSSITPGFRGGMKNLYEFLRDRIQFYVEYRNDPTKNGLSNMSPWLHFGQVSPQRCVLVTKKYVSMYKKSVESFCEELIIRRELADNFCFYNKNYDNLAGAADWARKTLNDHRKDKREQIYSKTELEAGKTHDNLWNAAQKQLCNDGKMHGYLRMYWAKKILEWSETPEEALAVSIYLNDKYSLDGRDANGYVGCMWSVCGIHDQGWRERPIFGKIRYMNYEGCKRKFDVKNFISRYK